MGEASEHEGEPVLVRIQQHHVLEKIKGDCPDVFFKEGHSGWVERKSLVLESPGSSLLLHVCIDLIEHVHPERGNLTLPNSVKVQAALTTAFWAIKAASCNQKRPRQTLLAVDQSINFLLGETLPIHLSHPQQVTSITTGASRLAKLVNNAVAHSVVLRVYHVDKGLKTSVAVVRASRTRDALWVALETSAFSIAEIPAVVSVACSTDRMAVVPSFTSAATDWTFETMRNASGICISIEMVWLAGVASVD